MASMSTRWSLALRPRVDRRAAILVALVALLTVASFWATLGPGQRPLAAALRRPAVVRLQVTLGDPMPSPVIVRPGEILALYLRSPTSIGGFWLPSVVLREAVLVPGVDYPPPLPSSAGFRQRYDAYTARSSGETSLRLQYAATDPAALPTSTPRNKDGVPIMDLLVTVKGPGLQLPSNLDLRCSGRSCSAEGFVVDVTRVVPHHHAMSPCLSSYVPGIEPPPCTPYLETELTLAFHNGSVYDFLTGPPDFTAATTGSNAPVKLQGCSYLQEQPEPPRDGFFLVPPGASVSGYVFCLVEPGGGLGPKLRWRPAGTSVAGDMAL